MFVAADRLDLAVRDGFIRPKTVTRHSLRLERSVARVAWRGALEQLPVFLREFAPKAVKVRVLVSNQFVRYVLVKKSSALSTDDEVLAFARHRYSNLYGAKTSDWEIYLSDPGGVSPYVAAAIDTGLLAEIRMAFAGAGSPAREVTPLFSFVFDACRRRMAGSEGWLIVAEPEYALIAHAGPVGWTSIQGRRVSDLQEALRLIEREELVSETNAPGNITLVDLTGGSRVAGARFEGRVRRMTLGQADPWRHPVASNDVTRNHAS